MNEIYKAVKSQLKFLNATSHLLLNVKNFNKNYNPEIKTNGFFSSY